MRLPRLCLFLLMIGLSLPLAGQTEKIVSFDSRIEVNPDASMLVKETIVVESAGVSMRHGIYREFPTRYKDRAGHAYVVGFEVVSVMRDGRAEAYHTEAMSNGVRVYFGASDTLLQPGRHAYRFSYRTNRQLGFFKDHDELYWNVTGNGWKFAIDQATATVVLPAQVRNLVTDLTAYTGSQGEQGTDFTAGRDKESNPVFQAGGLGPQQGLTIVVTWPKGYFQEPSTQQKLSWFLQDNRGAMAGVAGLAVVLLYYFVVWGMVGKDPAGGTLVPLYEPPDNLSPGAMRYLKNMGFDGKVFTSAIIGLAAKGYLRIEQVDSSIYRLVKKAGEEAGTKLAPEEKAMANLLFDDGDKLEMVPEHHLRMQRAQKALEHSLHDTMEKTLFVTNVRYLWPGIVLTVVTIATAMLMSGGSGAVVGAFMSVWLTGWTLGVSVLLRQAARAWQAVRVQGGLALVPAVVVSVFAIPFLGGEIFGIFLLGASVGAVVVLIFFAAIGTNILFHYLLKAPTRAGRQVLDRVEGFKMFLSAVEADRFERMMTVVKTPELFERFYPFAVALGVEHAWAQQFAQAMAAVAGPQGQSSGAGYLPSWYVSAGMASFSPSDFSSSFSGSFSSAVSSASTSPGSSSGSGGGGSSGGGGGGGGGGGW